MLILTANWKFLYNYSIDAYLAKPLKESTPHVLEILNFCTSFKV